MTTPEWLRLALTHQLCENPIMSVVPSIILSVIVTLLLSAVIRYVGRRLGKSTAPGARWLGIRMD